MFRNTGNTRGSDSVFDAADREAWVSDEIFGIGVEAVDADLAGRVDEPTVVEIHAHVGNTSGSDVAEEEQITPDSLLSAVHTLYENRQKMSDAMAASRQTDSIETIISLIEEAAGRNS